MNQFKGTVTFKGEVVTISDKLAKQTIVVVELGDAKYPASIAVDFVNDKIDMLKDVAVNDVVDLDLNFRANESKKQPGSFFNSISCWRLSKEAPTNTDDQPF